MEFKDTKKAGQVSGLAFKKGLHKFIYFVLVICLINPFCHISSFIEGFSEGLKGIK